MFGDELERVREMGREDGTARRPARDPTQWLDEEFGYAEEKLEAYTQEYGYSFGYQDGLSDDSCSGYNNGFVDLFYPALAWQSETAQESYDRGFNDGMAAREESSDQSDDDDNNETNKDSSFEDDGSTGGGGSASKEPLSWSAAPIFAAYFIFFTKAGWIVLGVTTFLTLGYCQHQAQPRRDAQRTSLYPKPSADPPREDPVTVSTGPDVQIDMLTLFEGVDTEYQSLGTALDELEINGSYGSPVREGIAAGFRFSRARSGETRFQAEIWAAHGRFREGICIPDRRVWRASATGEGWIASAEEGNFVCAYQGPMLAAGDYRVQIFVDESPKQSLNFRIVPKSAGSETPQVIGFSSREKERENAQKMREAWDRHHERVRAIDAKVAEVLRGYRDCFPDGEPCTTLSAQRRKEVEESDAILRAELGELQ
ncbi:MAG: hypothetical protein EON58_12565 [Alphaproteobacteria bacterium]|nr:MAG: hypothetical protein EON58_12565 [Alphaproteobacteria bacterium]